MGVARVLFVVGWEQQINTLLLLTKVLEEPRKHKPNLAKCQTYWQTGREEHSLPCTCTRRGGGGE